MNWGLLISIILKLLELMKDVEIPREKTLEISKEIKSAKTLEEVHVAIQKFRKKMG